MGFSSIGGSATLPFTEIADLLLAAGASCTPTVSGIFTAVQYAHVNFRTEIYSDNTVAWVLCGIARSATGVYALEPMIIGEANKIRFTNFDVSNHSIVVNKIG